MNPKALVVRGAAAAIAIVMVVVAFSIRDDDVAADGPTPAARTVVCPTDLQTVCREAVADADVRLSTETAGETADVLIAATDPAEFAGTVWIVPAAWARSVVDERARLGRAPLFSVSEALVSSPAALAIWESRATELAATCPTVDWTCLAEANGTPLAGGDRVSTGIASVESGVGLPLAAAQAADLLDTGDYASNDFPAIAALANRLAQGQTTDPLGTMRAQGPGRLTAVAVVAADAPNLASNFGPISLVPVSPAVRVDVVALTLADASVPGGVRDGVVRAFTAAGWDTGGADADGLPAGGVLAAIRSLWNER